MIRSLQRPALRDWLVVVLAAGQLAVFQLAAETATPVPAPQKLLSAPANLPLPSLPRVKSPVELFRELLAMTPAERENHLTNRPPGIRARILANLHPTPAEVDRCWQAFLRRFDLEHIFRLFKQDPGLDRAPYP